MTRYSSMMGLVGLLRLLLPYCFSVSLCLQNTFCDSGPHHFVSSASQLDPLAVALLALGQRQPQEGHEGLTSASARARPRKQPCDEGTPCLATPAGMIRC